MKRYLIVGLLLAAAAPLHGVKGQSLNERVAQLERILRNQSLSDIVLQLHQMQQEIQQLRGEVEMQEYAINALKRQQRDLYLDLDSRLSPPGTGSQPEKSSWPGAGAEQPQSPVEVPPVSAPAQAQDRTAPASAAGDPAREQAQYQEALDLLKQGDYQDSITAFGTFLDKYPTGRYADNAQYWLGEASYVMRDFDAALGDFDQILQRYPASPKVPGAMLKMGYIYYEQGSWAKARKVLGELAKSYPSSTEARLAKQRLQRMRKEGR